MTCECAVLRHQLRVAQDMAVAARNLTDLVSEVVRLNAVKSGNFGYRPLSSELQLADSLRSLQSELKRFGDVCVTAHIARGAECQE